MTYRIGYLRTILAAAALMALLTGCGGDKGETNYPAAPLTASKVVSTSDTSAHVHSVSIPFGDVTPTAAVDLQYRSDTVNGHSHVLALSPQQMIDLNNGMQLLSLVSSTPNSGTAHTHAWRIQGGNVLYEKTCYNCHSNDKRYRYPEHMVTLDGNQTGAIMSPGIAPTSTAPAAIPDPNYVPPVTGNAAAVYFGKCAVCHSLGAVDTVTGSGPSLSGTGGLVNGKFPAPGVASHNEQSLTSSEITALIAYFNTN